MPRTKQWIVFYVAIGVGMLFLVMLIRAGGLFGTREIADEA